MDKFTLLSTIHFLTNFQINLVTKSDEEEEEENITPAYFAIIMETVQFNEKCLKILLDGTVVPCNQQ